MLLEVAIVISIIGLISGFFVTRTIVANKMMKARITRENIEIVTESLAAFLANHHRLPRPASDNSGWESANTNGVGNVPFKTLEIPEKQTVDGNARPLIYIVESNLTRKDFQRIYSTNDPLDPQEYFCQQVNPTTIKIDVRDTNDNTADVVAFVIDTADNPPSVSDGIINVKVSTNTKWITRDLFLIRYLKSCSCHNEEPPKTSDLPKTTKNSGIPGFDY
ncbi:hypothetical protein FACS189449_03080 [Alphaproteobacteria bacterium]|nr:hypothetical protein FACS189449_03080 [Alphaproteobacteria bacterium]